MTNVKDARFMPVRSWLGFDDATKRKAWDDRIALTVGAVAVLLILVTVLGAVGMIYKIFDTPAPPDNANVLSEIFASRMMLAATRMAVLFVGLFIVLSVLIHIRRGQWLTAARSDRNEMRQRASDLADEVRRLEQVLAKAQDQLRRNEGQ